MIGQANKGQCLIIGVWDFNYPNTNWDSLKYNKEDEKFEEL